ncbi:hypothetical protein H0H87_012098 [Tephrocybe sp. NHM501043]|nr:hypothetical protein H0H87_012098 [Tephrocybe sp. NHM501043]
MIQCQPQRYHVDPDKAYWGTFEEGETHAIARKLTAGVMSDVRAGKTEPYQEFEALLNIQKLLDDGGKNWFHHIERVVASAVLAVGFGIHCPTGEEPELKAISHAIAELVELTTPSASIVNIFPLLDYIPGPMPWRARARAFRENDKAIYTKLINEALTGRASGMNTCVACIGR